MRNWAWRFFSHTRGLDVRRGINNERELPEAYCETSVRPASKASVFEEKMMYKLPFARARKPYCQQLGSFLRGFIFAVVSNSSAGWNAICAALILLTRREQKSSLDRISPGTFAAVLLGFFVCLSGASATAEEVAKAMIENAAASIDFNPHALNSDTVSQSNNSQRLNSLCASPEREYDSQIIDQSGKVLIRCRDIEQQKKLISGELIRQALLLLSCAFVVYYLRRIYAEENVRTGLRGIDIAENATRDGVKLPTFVKSDSLSYGYHKSFRSRV